MDFCDLTQDDLNNWNADLSRVLTALPSADTLFIPCGFYKMETWHHKWKSSWNKRKQKPCWYKDGVSFSLYTIPFEKREKLRRCIDVHEIRDLQNTAWNVKTQTQNDACHVHTHTHEMIRGYVDPQNPLVFEWLWDGCRESGRSAQRDGCPGVGSGHCPWHHQLLFDRSPLFLPLYRLLCGATAWERKTYRVLPGWMPKPFFNKCM